MENCSIERHLEEVSDILTQLKEEEKNAERTQAIQSAQDSLDCVKEAVASCKDTAIVSSKRKILEQHWKTLVGLIIFVIKILMSN